MQYLHRILVEQVDFRSGRCAMEAQWMADRWMLRTLLRTQPQWTQRDYAEAVGRSMAWVKTWTKRLRAAPADDVAVLRSQSRARNQPPPKLSLIVIDRLLEIRSAPPAPLHRIPGPKTIRSYLEQDLELRAQGVRLPRSTRTATTVTLAFQQFYWAVTLHHLCGALMCRHAHQ
jgi:hypothetical protein